MSFFAELKRRNVFRVAAAYAVTAWLLAQIADVALGNFGAPDWVAKSLLLILILGFPLAVLFAWAFELTPEGLKREKEAGRSESSAVHKAQKLNRVIIIALVVAVGFLLVDKFGFRAGTSTQSDKTVVTATETVAIAVLAFDDLSESGDQTYLAEGIAEELLNRLSSIPDMHVIARTSAFSLKNKELTIKQISERLGVGVLLDGAIRLSGDDLRVSVSLIDAKSERNTWSQTYDRKLEDIFTIQDDIAASVVNHLRVSLLQQVSTRRIDPVAYTLYLNGRQLNRRNTFEHAERAKPILERAIAIEPEFVDAMLELVHARMISSFLSGATPNELRQDLENVLPLLERAALLEPDNASIMATQAFIDVVYIRNPDKGLALLERALTLAPGNDNVITVAASAYGLIGMNERAITLWTDLLTRDPLCPGCHYAFVAALIGADRLEEGENSLETLLAIAEGVRLTESINWMGALRLLQGQPGKALEIFEDSRVWEPHRSLGMALALHDIGRSEEFELLFAQLKDRWTTPESAWGEGIVTIYGWIGDLDQAFEWLDRDMTAHDHSAEIYGGMWGPYFRNLRADPRWDLAKDRLEHLRAQSERPPTRLPPQIK